jgi:hypothetical protein
MLIYQDYIYERRIKFDDNNLIGCYFMMFDIVVIKKFYVQKALYE